MVEEHPAQMTGSGRRMLGIKTDERVGHHNRHALEVNAARAMRLDEQLVPAAWGTSRGQSHNRARLTSDQAHQDVGSKSASSFGVGLDDDSHENARIWILE